MRLTIDVSGTGMSTRDLSLGYTFTPFWTGGEADELTFSIDDAILNEVTGSLLNYEFGFTEGSQPDLIISATPYICEVDGNVVSNIDTGLGQIDLIKNSVKTSVFLPFSQTGPEGQASVRFYAYTPGTVSAALADEVFPLMTSDTPDLDYYSTFNHATGTYTRNTNCWMTLDLGAVVAASSYWGGWTPERGGTAITRRHVLITHHYPIDVGLILRFVDSDDVVHARTVIGTWSMPYHPLTAFNDYRILTLDSNLPLAITPMKIAGEWIAKPHYPSGYHPQWVSFYMGGLGFWVNKQRKVFAALLGNGGMASSNTDTFTVNEVEYTAQPTMAQAMSFRPEISDDFLGSSIYFAGKLSYLGQVVSGNSGHPVCTIVNGEPVLVMVWTTNTHGPRTWTTGLLNNFIAMADADAIARGNLATPTGYTVTVAADPTL